MFALRDEGPGDGGIAIGLMEGGPLADIMPVTAIPTPDKGIDGTVELTRLLEELSQHAPMAGQLPRSKAMYADLTRRLHEETIQQFVLDLIERVGIWWSVDAYAVMPVMTPWCVRDRSCRYDQGPESWGAPREDGYMRDDNSIVKKLPLPVTVHAPDGHPYAGRKPWRGFTACHIWRTTAANGVAGEDPWIYSFMPNLVWLPSWLAPLTDREGSLVQTTLQRTSWTRYRDAPLRPSVAPYARTAWERLLEPPNGPTLQGPLPEFRPNASFFGRRRKTLSSVVEGCRDISHLGHPRRKLICSRFTEGLPLIDRTQLEAFASAMDDYEKAVGAAVAGS